MTDRSSLYEDRGFAIILTLILLSLLVLIALAVSSVSRTQTDLADSTLPQLRARQNALLGMRVALGKLQVAAGPDARVTGMAGITGIEAHRNNSTRHWSGVWTAGGAFLGWMVSGAGSTGVAQLGGNAESIELWGGETMGGLATDSERVIAGKLVVGQAGNATAHYAYAVVDEGVKIPVHVPTGILAQNPQIFSRYATSTGDVRSRLRDAVGDNETQVATMLNYEQLGLLNNVTGATLQDNLHHVTLRSQYPDGGLLRSGKVNINTNSKRVWQGLLNTYNLQVVEDERISSAQIRLRGEDLGETAAEFASGGLKLEYRPFLNTDPVVPFLLSEFPGGNGSPNGSAIMDELRPMLTTRSDTFRIRAYGDAINPADADDPNATPESVAYCEAMVQRIPDMLDPARPDLGRRFVITYFRWLGPDDI